MRVLLIAALALSAITISTGFSMPKIPTSELSINTILGANVVPAPFDKMLPMVNPLNFVKSLFASPATSSLVYATYANMFNKTQNLKPQELQTRIKNFVHVVLRTVQHNLKFDEGGVTWQMGVNQFTDMTAEELLGRLKPLETGSRTGEEDAQNVMIEDRGLSSTPATLDWRTQGGRNIVGPVPNQQTCGSCVTFSTSGIVESAYAMATDKILTLSKQELLDCTPENKGCDGGWYTNSLKQVENYGMASESTYPYKNKQGACPANRGARAVQSVNILSTGSCAAARSATNATKESVLRDACAKYGPVGVAVAVDDDWFRYKSGIYVSGCAGAINHAVHIIGYGKGFFIIKNSWDTTWGEKGFMRIQSGNNKCQVADYCFYVTVG